LQSQRDDGGWGYRADRDIESYASMTESGISSLIICRRLGDSPATENRQSIDRGLEWLAHHFSIEQNTLSSYQQGRLFYHLFALERTGTLLGAKDMCGHDWFREGAAFLLASQRSDGSWDDGADMPVVHTCFALLFLVKASEFLR
jgi:hypothetical protein